MAYRQEWLSNDSQLKRFLGVFRYSRRAIGLVWSVSKVMTITMALLTLTAGLLPAAAAWVGQLIVDAVVTAMNDYQQHGNPDTQGLILLITVEAGIITLLSAVQRGISLIQSLLRSLLGQEVNVLILEKAQRLELSQFEDSEFYDKLLRARREASSRPLSLVNKTFGLIQNGISLVGYGFLLFSFSPWALVMLVFGALPVFVAETKFSNDAFQLFRRRSPETRMQMYLETVLAREDSVKEVKLFCLGELFLQRYKDIFKKLFAADKNLSIKRDFWGFILGLLGIIVFYCAYGWVVITTVAGKITLGQMTMYLLVFRQGQAAVSAILAAISGMYEDNLYLSNLYEYLEQETLENDGVATKGSVAGDGVRFNNVSFTYDGAEKPALNNISFHLSPGKSLALVGENGSGKTTLIKLLTRLYRPQQGTILLDGLDINDWKMEALRQRIGVIFQDFMRYQLLVGENIGIGDVDNFMNKDCWKKAAEKGMAASFIDNMKNDYDTQLGRWFKSGQELSGGQWQKIALSRAFMRDQADILVLDEPTSAMDAAAEATIFEHFRKHTKNKMAILISHRFSTVRMADLVIVIQDGSIIEKGSHDELVKLGGHYAYLFALQASGYR